MDEHDLGDADDGAVEGGVGRGGDGDPEAAGVARVARLLQAVLVALQEELQLEPAGERDEVDLRDLLVN